MQASSQNQIAAYYMGIPVQRINGLVWGLAAAVAAIAGLLLAPITFVHANMGFIGLKAFPAAVVGGFGSLPGAIVGGLIIGIVESLSGFYLPEGFKDIAPYIVVLLMLMLKPNGLFGEKLRKKGTDPPPKRLRRSPSRGRASGPAEPVPRRPLDGRRVSACAWVGATDMRFIFKTDYEQDLRLAKHGGQVFWYSLLMAVPAGAPWLLPSYWLAQLTFVLIYAVVGLGLMLLAGFTGQFSIGHAAFLGVGAYTQAVLVNAHWPFPLALACAAALSAIVGIAIGVPALRVKGIYLGIATLAFGFIVEEGLARWESVTGGNAGMHVKDPALFGWTLSSDTEFYFLCLVVAVLSTLAILNLLRSPTGRAFVAIRDSEISAQSMGIHLARYKTLSFAHLGGAGRAGGRVVCAQDQVPVARAVQHRAVDRPAAAGGHRRPGLGARRVPRCDLPHHHAAADFAGQGLPAGIGGPVAGPAGRGLRRGAGGLRDVRAARPVRPLAEDAHLSAAVPVLPRGHVPPAEGLPEVRQAEMTCPPCSAPAT